MNKAHLVMLQSSLALWLTAFGAQVLARQELPKDRSTPVVFFDVSELPARIDEPRLRKSDKEFVLDCAVANRSGEQLLGIRLILLVIDSAGKLRSRITWTERADLAMYSIKTFAFQPGTGDLRSTDQLFLGIDEVIGRETIWHATGAEKALRAYSRGHHDVMPTVRTFANKYDSPPGFRVIPLEKKD